MGLLDVIYFLFTKKDCKIKFVAQPNKTKDAVVFLLIVNRNSKSPSLRFRHNFLSFLVLIAKTMIIKQQKWKLGNNHGWKKFEISPNHFFFFLHSNEFKFSLFFGDKICIFTISLYANPPKRGSSIFQRTPTLRNYVSLFDISKLFFLPFLVPIAFFPRFFS